MQSAVILEAMWLRLTALGGRSAVSTGQVQRMHARQHSPGRGGSAWHTWEASVSKAPHRPWITCLPHMLYSTVACPRVPLMPQPIHALLP